MQQQRQLRLGDILDDYCPRERRLTNHAVVAMVGPDVKQTRCTTCDAEHEYKHAKVPRQRRKGDTPAALSPRALAGRPKRIVHEPPPADVDATSELSAGQELNPLAFVPPGAGVITAAPAATGEPMASGASLTSATIESSTPVAADALVERDEQVAVAEDEDEGDERERRDHEDRERGPVHRPLIRASLPRPEGQPPPTRPAPEFTIRQPASRTSRFRPRHARAGQPFPGNRVNGSAGGSTRGGMPRHQGGRPPIIARPAKRHDRGRKRSK